MDPFAGFEWDADKARANFRKHGVDFAGAVAVFEDEQALTIQDEVSAVDEQRYLTVGRDVRGRRATPSERRQYLEQD